MGIYLFMYLFLEQRGKFFFFALQTIKIRLERARFSMGRKEQLFSSWISCPSHGSISRSARLSSTGKAAGISGESGSQGSEGPDLERDYCVSHTPKVGPVSKCNRTSFGFIKYLDNWKVPVNGNLFQLCISQRLIYPFRFLKSLSGGCPQSWVFYNLCGHEPQLKLPFNSLSSSSSSGIKIHIFPIIKIFYNSNKVTPENMVVLRQLNCIWFLITPWGYGRPIIFPFAAMSLLNYGIKPKGQCWRKNVNLQNFSFLTQTLCHKTPVISVASSTPTQSARRYQNAHYIVKICF